MPSYELIYFDARGLGELSRLLFALGGQEYKDTRLNSDQIKALKPELTTGQVPVLKVDGQIYSQSAAISKYLAREFGLYGKTHLEGLQIDEVLGILKDLFNQAIKVIYSEEAKQAELLAELKEKHAPLYLGALEKLLKKGKDGFFVGGALTLADVAVYDHLYTLSVRFDWLLADHPALVQQGEKVANVDRIKQWIAKRPQTKS